LNKTTTELGVAEDGVLDLRTATEKLDDQFAELQGRFEGDQAIRSLYENIDKLSEETIEATSDIYDMKTGFDLTTAEGQKYSAQLETLSTDLLDVAAAHRDGTATSLELTNAQRAVEAQLRDVARQLGLTDAETEALIAEYARVPDDVHTEIVAEGNAFDKTRQLIADLRGLDGLRTFNYIDTVKTTVYRSRVAGGNNAIRDGGIRGMAGGGIGGSGMTLVGEEGPELVRLGIGAQVYSTSDTDAMLTQRRNFAGGGSGRGGPSVTINGQGSIISERDVRGLVADALRRAGIDQLGLRGNR